LTGVTVCGSSDEDKTQDNLQFHPSAFDFLKSGRGCSVLVSNPKAEQTTENDQTLETGWDEDPNLTALPDTGTSLSKVTTAASHKVDDSEHRDRRYALAVEDSNLTIPKPDYISKPNVNGLIMRKLTELEDEPFSADSQDDTEAGCFGWRASRWVKPWGGRRSRESRSASKVTDSVPRLVGSLEKGGISQFGPSSSVPS
jgi:hypothetical protein